MSFFISLPLEINDSIFDQVLEQPHSEKSLKTYARTLCNLSQVSKHFEAVVDDELKAARKFHLINKYNFFKEQYENFSKFTQGRLVLIEIPFLCNALGSGVNVNYYPFTSSPVGTFTNYSEEIEKDISDIIRLFPQSLDFTRKNTYTKSYCGGRKVQDHYIYINGRIKYNGEHQRNIFKDSDNEKKASKLLHCKKILAAHPTCVGEETYTPLFLACINSDVSLHIIEKIAILKNGKNLNEKFEPAQMKHLMKGPLLDYLEQNIDNERFEDIKNLFKKVFFITSGIADIIIVNKDRQGQSYFNMLPKEIVYEIAKVRFLLN